jgi:hypothetical protein
MKPYREDGREFQPYYNTESGIIMTTETPSDMEYMRRKSIAAGHCRPDHPVFNPEDYT